jgi:hypothetical protein
LVATDGVSLNQFIAAAVAEKGGLLALMLAMLDSIVVGVTIGRFI